MIKSQAIPRVAFFCLKSPLNCEEKKKENFINSDISRYLGRKCEKQVNCDGNVKK